MKNEAKLTSTRAGVPDRGLVWLNGQFMDFAAARVSVEDRGFQFGDGIYETIRVYDGTPFAIEQHIERLSRSAAAIELELPMSGEEFVTIAQELIARSGLKEAEVYIQVTRGAAPRLHPFPIGVSPTVVMTVRPVRPIPRRFRERGIVVKTFPDERWARCDIKTICLLPNVLAVERARRAGADEALFVRDGLVTEGTSSNVFIVHRGEVVTPPADHRILAGVTRGLVLEIARGCGYQTDEREIPLSDLKAASEVFITSTVKEVLAVVRVDDAVIGNGEPGDVFRRLYDVYRSQLPGRRRASGSESVDESR